MCTQDITTMAWRRRKKNSSENTRNTIQNAQSHWFYIMDWVALFPFFSLLSFIVSQLRNAPLFRWIQKWALNKPTSDDSRQSNIRRSHRNDNKLFHTTECVYRLDPCSVLIFNVFCFWKLRFPGANHMVVSQTKTFLQIKMEYFGGKFI